MKLYAYATPEIPKHAGYLKVGETHRSTNKRIDQQGGQVNIEKVPEWQDAIATERKGIDRLFRHFLRDKYGFPIQPNISGHGESEWVKCTVHDLIEAFPKFKEQFFQEQRERQIVSEKFYKEIRNWFYWTTQEHPTIDPDYALRLVVRLLFCFFLREKNELVPKELLDPSIEKLLKRDEEYSFYNGVLRNLFFSCINTPNGRKYENEKLLANKKIKEWFSKIPFLNGGLFDEHENDSIPIGNDYFFSEKKERLLTALGAICDVYGIMTILCKYQYKLTLDDLLDKAEYGKTVDPEFIGKVFESLLSCIHAGSQKTRQEITGSYYTPREIVDDMVNASLDAYLETKRQTDTLSSDTELLLQCKILDPACGSGAFPCEAMNIIMHRIEEDKKIRENTEFSPQDRYRTKLKIVRDVICGVDIQPMAVQITLLRFFLSLIQDISPDKQKKNFGIDPLPNLEVKFVCADTLIPLVTDRKDSKGHYQKMLENPVIRNTNKLLRDNRSQYFMASMIDRKHEIRQTDKTLRETLAIAMEGNGMITHETTKKMATWDPYDHSVPASFFDAEWMFMMNGGFDIVIGNPPYVDSETMVASHLPKRELYASIYTSTVGNWDLFVPFVERGINLSHQHGVVSFIIPNKIISQDYATKMREILSSHRLLEIRDYSRQNVFPIANVYPVTIIVKKEPIDFGEIKMTTMQTTVAIERTSIVSNKIMNRYPWDMFFCTPELTPILIKIAHCKNNFGHLVEFSSPCTVAESYEIKAFLSDSSIVSDGKKLINSGTIDRYVSKWGSQSTKYIKGKYLHPVVSNKSLKDMNGNRYHQSSTRKIIVANMTTVLEAFLDTQAEYLAGKSTVIGISDDQHMLFLTGLLNSHLMSIWYQSVYHSTKMSGGALSVTANRINQIPIPNVSAQKHQPVIDRVKKIISAKRKNPATNTTELELEIDALVYQLYGLKSEEIEIVTKCGAEKIE